MATVAELQEDLALYKAARKAILEGHQEYSNGKRRFVRADLATVERTIGSLEMRLSIAQQGGALGHSVTVFGGRR